MEEKELEIDDIRITYGEYGKVIERIEILLIPEAKLVLDIDEEITLSVEDVDSGDASVTGTIEKDTLTALIKNLNIVRKQLNKN